MASQFEAHEHPAPILTEKTAQYRKPYETKNK